MVGEKTAHQILPSVCTAMDSTTLFGVGLNESARPVVGSSRASLCRVCPPMFVNWPHTSTLPSACTANYGPKVRIRVEGGIERTVNVQPGNIVAGYRRCAIGTRVVNAPPRRTLPSVWTRRVDRPFAFGSKPSNGRGEAGGWGTRRRCRRRVGLGLMPRVGVGTGLRWGWLWLSVKVSVLGRVLRRE